jgi:hypothetical protein
MPKLLKAEFSTFVKGLITEASPLNFPDNASLDEENFILSKDGTRRRRKGIDIEEDGVLRSAGVTVATLLTRNPTTYQWLSPSGIEDLVILVVQVNNQLHFFDQANDNISDDGFLNTLAVSLPTDVSYSFATVDGYLVIASGDKNICIIEYQAPTTFSVSYDRLKTRDLWGVEVSGSAYETDVAYRDSAVPPDAHKYNLQNQSWGIPRRDGAGVVSDPTAIYNTGLSLYPSNSEVVWTGLQFKPDAIPFEAVYPNLYTDTLGADVLAPKGYYIIDLLDRGDSRETEFAANKVKYPELLYTSVSLPTDSTPNGATVVADFAGRIFYGGFSGEVVGSDNRSPSLNSYVFFTQLIKSKRDFFKCYQEGSPASRENFDLVDTDGGFIRISGMNKLIGMVDLSSSLILIADNGVWQITGGSDYGFSPVNLKVARLSSFGGVSTQSILEVNGMGMFWGKDGIYAINKDQFGDFKVISLTENTIQTLYDNIPATSKSRSSGAYNTYTKRAHWVYKEDSIFTQDSRTYELVFDSNLEAFSRNRIYQTTADMPAGQVAETFNVIPPINTATEVDVTQECIYLFVIGSILTNTAAFGFALYRSENFVDWDSLNFGRDAYAYLVTGATAGGDSGTRKFLPYITTHMLRTEEGVDPTTLEPLKQSGCLMRVRWGWSDNLASSKWSRLQQIYRYRLPQFVTGPSDPYENGFIMVSAKSKVRGSGNAFSTEFQSEQGKDCVLVGWNIFAQGNDV